MHHLVCIVLVICGRCWGLFHTLTRLGNPAITALSYVRAAVFCCFACMHLRSHMPSRAFLSELLQVIGPDVEFVLSRAQAIQEEQSAPIVTVTHLNNALESLQLGGGGGGANADGLTKADLEATMKQMLMVGSLHSDAMRCIEIYLSFIKRNERAHNLMQNMTGMVGLVSNHHSSSSSSTSSACFCSQTCTCLI